VTRAQWALKAEDISATPARITEFLTVGQLSNETGLAEETLLDPLTRTEITNKDNPRGALCRPTHRFHDIPLWSRGQLEDYRNRLKGKSKPDLPPVSQLDAAERDLFSTVELAALLGVHDQTLRRAQNNDDAYPPAVARRTRNGNPGVPEHVRELDKVLAWARTRGYGIPDDIPDRIRRLGLAPSGGVVEPHRQDLPVVSRTEVRSRALVDIETVSGWWEMSPADLNSRREHFGGFPKAVGRVLSESTHKWRHVFESDPVLDWGRSHGFAVDPQVIVRSLETSGT
jgi:hypothetical protein